MPTSINELTAWKGNTRIAFATVPLGEFVVGRVQADFIVDDENVSDAHARLSIRHHELYVEDLGSESGTFVNGQRVTSRQRLYPSQKVRIGTDIWLEARRLPCPHDEDDSLSPQAAALERQLPRDPRRERRYQVGNVVARGGMGVVMEAYDQPIRRTVAMKVMLAGSSESSIARFIAEARITGQLEHPNIVPVHEFGVDEHDQPFYAMKYVRGVTLKDIVDRLRKQDPEALQAYPLAELLTILQKICDAVGFAHSQGVIHRDLKPENVMVGRYGEVLVMDWGLAKLTAAAGHGHDPEAVSTNGGPPGPPPQNGFSIDGAVMGTPRYMSPEQASGTAVDSRSDIYALGALLHTLLHLQPPVEGAEVQEILNNVRRGLIVPPPGKSATASGDSPVRPHLGGRVPASLAAVAYKAMSLRPPDRYQTVADLQAEINAFRGGFATRAEQAPAWKLFWLAVARYKREAVLIAIFLLLLAIGGALTFFRLARERSISYEALDELRKSAPAFLDQAKSLVAQERFAEALDKVDYALKLCPESPEYLLAKGDLLRCQLKFAEAVEPYQRAGRLDPAGRGHASAALCERMQATSLRGGNFPRETLAELMQAMMRERRPPAELMQVARPLGEEQRVARAYWLERLRDLTIEPEPPLEQRFTARPDGSLALDLSATSVSDLQPLVGMPLAELNLAGCPNVRSLGPLRGLPLRVLNLTDTQVTDLSPLQGSKLEHLSLRSTPVSDLKPLAGVPLKSLDCSNTPAQEFLPLAGGSLEVLQLDGTAVKDLSFLRGQPLKVLSLGGCPQIRGLSGVAALTALEVLVLPENFYQLPPEEIAAVRTLEKHPALRQLDATSAVGRRPLNTPSKAAFWLRWAGDLGWLEKLATGGVMPKLRQFADGSWEVDFRDQPLRDLACVEGAPISELGLFNTQVTDLRPLASLPLRSLDLRLSPVTDLGPLRGMALQKLFLWRTRIADFSVLETLTALEVLDAPETSLSDLRVIKSRRLRELRIGTTPVADLEPLAGLPLERLHCDHIPARDLRPLLRCPQLKWLVPPGAECDLAPLRAMKSLERISYLWFDESMPTMTALEFWNEYNRSHPN